MLKVEYVHRHRFATRAEARLKISTWITQLLQHQAPPQRRRRAVTRHLREHHPRST
ncbi:hypothetical protein [Streptomyces niveus]|uniref:Integrase n=1 Tax=Streptomyces niveus TaxID=193462 RepID=A0ABZ2AEX6_STRNV|nr:hypothetical protein [Streptomyces niveus]